MRARHTLMRDLREFMLDGVYRYPLVKGLRSELISDSETVLVYPRNISASKGLKNVTPEAA